MLFCGRHTPFPCLRLPALGVLTGVFVVLTGCWTHQGLDVEITSLPYAEPATPYKLVSISGRVSGAQPGQQIVLYARSQAIWYVQPYANHPFTAIRKNGTWSAVTHPGLAYAALLVGPGFEPPAVTNRLPAQGVLASSVKQGAPAIWQRWWFVSAGVLLGLLAIFGVYQMRVNHMRNKLRLRYEERLAERMRITQILHDTLLQGVISASMQLHVAVDQLPPDTPAMGALRHVLHSMGQVVEEGRNTLRGMQSPLESGHELERALSRVPAELGIEEHVDLRVAVKGPALPLRTGVCGDLYHIGRETLVSAFRTARATKAGVELRYTATEFRLLVRHNGRESMHPDLSILRKDAQRIGARLKIRRRITGGTEIHLLVPGHVVFESPAAPRAHAWFNAPHGREREKV